MFCKSKLASLRLACMFCAKYAMIKTHYKCSPCSSVHQISCDTNTVMQLYYWGHTRWAFCTLVLLLKNKRFRLILEYLWFLPPTFSFSINNHVTSQTRPSRFSACNIEKLGEYEWPGDEASLHIINYSLREMVEVFQEADFIHLETYRMGVIPWFDKIRSLFPTWPCI